MNVGLEREGTVVFEIYHEHKDWPTNNYGYNFGRFMSSGIAVSAVKYPDRVFEVVVSGPCYRTVIFKPTLPDGFREKVMVAITWKYPKITLYLNGKEFETYNLDPIKISLITVKIEGMIPKIPTEVIESVINDIKPIFNNLSAFLTSNDPAELKRILEYQLDLSKFNLKESSIGSWKGVFEGSKKVFNFIISQQFKNLLAIINGYSKRMADAYVREKEANASIAESKAQQEKLETLKKAAILIKKISQTIAESSQVFTAEEKNKLITEYLLTPMKRFTSTLVENKLSITIEESDKN